MPRGKYVNHKGRNRHFTTPEEIEKESESSESSAESGTASDDESGPESSASKKNAKKGVAGLIEIENPNRVSSKAAATKLKNLSLAEGEPAPKPELSRREREEIQKQANRARYEKLHAAGKTDEAKADLARLAIIREQRAEAAKRRENEKAAAAASKAAK